MAGGIVTNAKSVAAQIQKHMAVVTRNMEEAIPAVAVYTAREIVEPGANPVLTGKSRSGWNGSKSAPIYVEDPEIVSPEAVVSKVSQAVGRKSDIAYLANGVPYITQLEAGSSSKAPQGFVRQALVRAVQKVEQIKLLEPGSAARVKNSLL